ncbi:hypothetical protein ACJZ2D_013473 [Fusarium nematophilum]
MDGNSLLCSPPGRPDIYGVGIRTSFYIQWLGSLLIEHVSEQHLPDMRFLSAFSSAAASTSLVIGVAQGKLQPLDIYLLLLLAMGFFLFFMPLHAWRLVTKCHPQLDPFFLTDEVHGQFWHVMTFVMLAANAAMGTWFYTAFMPQLDRDCRDLVFVFGKVDLENRIYVVAAAVFYIGILAVVGGYIFLSSCCDLSPPPDARFRRIRRRHMRRFRLCRLLSGCIVFTLLVLAIELPIRWNNTNNVSEFATLAQLIPFFLSMGLFLRSWAVYKNRGSEEDEDEEENESSTNSTQSSQQEEGEMQENWGNVYDYGDWPQPQWPPGVYYSPSRVDAVIVP